MTKEEEIKLLGQLRNNSYFCQAFSDSDIDAMIYNIEQDHYIMNNVHYDIEHTKHIKNLNWYRKTLKNLIHRLRASYELQTNYRKDLDGITHDYDMFKYHVVRIVENSAIEDLVDANIMNRKEVIKYKLQADITLSEEDNKWLTENIDRL